MKAIRIVTFAVMLAALAGCGSARSQSKDPGPPPGGRMPSNPTSSQTVSFDRATFVLHVSNQSFDEPKADLTVAIDGRTVVEGVFPVEGQHNWASYALSLAPGTHTLSAKAASGATTQQRFEIVADGKRYAVLNYWNDEEEGAKFTWDFGKDQPGFG